MINIGVYDNSIGDIEKGEIDLIFIYLESWLIERELIFER